MQFIKENRNPNTAKTYEHYTKKYQEFCEAEGCEPFPEDVDQFSTHLALFTTVLAKSLSPASIELANAAIANKFSLLYNFPNPLSSPLLKATIKAATAASPRKNSQKAKAVKREELKLIMKLIMKDVEERQEKRKGRKGRNALAPCRDATLFAISFNAALRRSEAVGLNNEDMILGEETFEGRKVRTLSLTIRKSKTNPEGLEEKQVTAKIYESDDFTCCPISWWLLYNEIKPNHGQKDPAFQTDSGDRLSIGTPAQRLKEWARKAGISGKISSHSLRRGAATEASAKGADIDELRILGRWTRNSSSVNIYVDPTEQKQSAAAKLLAGWQKV